LQAIPYGKNRCSTVDKLVKFEIDPTDIDKYRKLSIYFATGDNSKLFHKLQSLEEISSKQFEWGVVLETSKFFTLINYPFILLLKFYQFLYRKFQFHDRECVQIPNCSNFAIGTLMRFHLISSFFKIRERVKSCSRSNNYIYFN
jgi:putative component of membrane protein insertase Oxa1/YidC/SpoIIIJ protein YidD